MAPGPDPLRIRGPRTLTTVWFRGRWRSWPPNPGIPVTRRRQTEISTGCWHTSSPAAGLTASTCTDIPAYLHFIAYVIQGTLECGILRRRDDAIQAAAKPAWVLLRKFETHKRLLGTYEPDFKGGPEFTCLTGNAQMSCVWLRLFEVTGDLRYLNAALKMNEMLKQLLPAKGRREVVGGVAGSYPIWGAYQPMRFISWGGKFLADALMLEQRLTREFEAKFEAKFDETKFEAVGMRVVILCSSPYSETGCAVAARLAQLGYFRLEP